MKVLVVNVQHAKGVSKSNAPYDICTISYGTQVQSVNRENRQVSGFGFQIQELGLEPSAMTQFSSLTFPTVVDLDVQPDPRNLNRNVCVGIRK